MHLSPVGWAVVIIVVGLPLAALAIWWLLLLVTWPARYRRGRRAYRAWLNGDE